MSAAPVTSAMLRVPPPRPFGRSTLVDGHVLIRLTALGTVVAAVTWGLSKGPAEVALLAIVILLGVPHGALDTEVARPMLRPRFGRWWFPMFAIPYLGMSVIVLIAWRLAPSAALMGFLLISVMHFGEEDTGIMAGSGRGLISRVAHGGAPIGLPILLQPTATAHLLGNVALLPFDAVAYWLRLSAAAWIPLAFLVVVDEFRHRRYEAAIEMLALVPLYLLLPPLAGFTIYFVGLHAPRHMAALAADAERAPRIGSLRDATFRSIPVTALTLLLGAMLWPLFPGSGADRLLALTLQSLAALTVPHMVLDGIVDRRSVSTRRKRRGGAVDFGFRSVSGP